MKHVKIMNDENGLCYFGDVVEDWELVVFTSQTQFDKYIGYSNSAGTVCGATAGLRRKIDCRTAFILDVYRHSGEAWSFTGEGTQCEWDTTKYGGVLLYKGKAKYLPKEKEERWELAGQHLKNYNRSISEGYIGYEIQSDEEDTEEYLDSCWGYLEEDACLQDAWEHIKDGEEFTFEDLSYRDISLEDMLKAKTESKIPYEDKGSSILSPSVWEFVEKNHPNYSGADEVLHSDIFTRYLENEEISDDDVAFVLEGKPEGVPGRVWAQMQLHKIDADIIERSIELFVEENKTK